MSYCRFSSDGFMSDVYVYSDVRGGYTCHIASNRLKERAPEVFWEGITTEEYTAAKELYREHMNNVEREDIELEHAGETFNLETPMEMVGLLLELRELGYNIPQRAIDRLSQEDRGAN